MRHNILIGGRAGQGMNELANTIASSLMRAGFYTFNYRDYQSVIRGGNSFNIVCFSDKPVHSYDENIDILIALDANTYSVHKEHLKQDCIIITRDSQLSKQLNSVFVETNPDFGIASNMSLAGALFKILNIEKKFLVDELCHRFKECKLESYNKIAMNKGYSADYNVNISLNVSPKKVSGELLTGSDAIVLGTEDAKVDLYFGYPMTPSTEVLTKLAQRQKISVFTSESEIAAINMALGASFAGRKVMTGTSGGGYDLMTEALSLQGITELPLVVHLAQRVGPGTGAPTYTSQADLNIALYGGHGEFPRVVLAPGDAEEAYEKTIEAFYFAEKFGVLSILLTDKHLAESGFVSEIKKNKLLIPKREKIFKKDSYIHDLAGNTREDASSIKQNLDRLNSKNKLIAEELTNFTTHKAYGEGNKLIIGFGSTKGAIFDALSKLDGFEYLHLIYLNPMPLDVIEKIKSAEKIFVVENNSTGLLADLIIQKTGKTVERILKYNGRPFTPEEIVSKLRRYRNG